MNRYVTGGCVLFFLSFGLMSCGTELKPGFVVKVEAEENSFFMVYSDTGTFPLGRNAEATIHEPYWIGQTEVTWGLWKAVYDWATSKARGENIYTFANEGLSGSNLLNKGPQFPVTKISWRDALIWTNALNEWLTEVHGAELTPVYYANGLLSQPLRDSVGGDFQFLINEAPGSIDNPYIRPDATGFRLPTSLEYEMAARWKGLDSSDGAIEVPVGSGQFWTPPLFASGAKDIYTNGRAMADVSWFRENADQGEGLQAHPVAKLRANSLGLYDMSGNVWEWCIDWNNTAEYVARVTRGGGWSSDPLALVVTEVSGLSPFSLYHFQGFRLARSAD